jgi:hypothetical protein
MSMQQAANDQAQNVNLPADSMAFRLSMPRQPVRQAGSAVLWAGYFADSLPAVGVDGLRVEQWDVVERVLTIVGMNSEHPAVCDQGLDNR